MKKVNRKIIIIILLLIILTLQIGPAVMAIENNTQDDYKTLEQYLIEHGVDEDNNGKISDHEWAKVKNLEDLDETINDFTGIEKAVNLQYLKIDSAYILQIDFSKLTKLKKLEISDSYNQKKNVVKLPAMPELKEIACYGIDDLDISKLENLNTLYIYGCGYIKLPKFKNLKYINVYESKINETIDLQNCENVYGYINEEIDKEKIKLNKNTMLTKDTEVYYLEKLEDEIDIPLNKNYEINYKVIKNENDNVVTFNSNYEYYTEIKTNNIGTTNIIIKDILGKEKTIKINVYKPEVKNYDTKLENTGITAKFLDDNTILKSNGELWKTNSFITAEKIDKNIKDYKTMYSGFDYDVLNIQNEYINVNDYVIGNRNYGFGMNDAIDLELTLKNDNSLNIKYNLLDGYEDNNHTTKKISNVKEIGNSSYLTTDGKFYKININYITEELKIELIKENVKKLIDDCIVLNDDTTWYTIKKAGKYECNKLADFAIKDMGLYYDKNDMYEIAVIDNEDNLWGCKEAFFANGLKLLVKESEWKKCEKYQNTFSISLSKNGDAELKDYNKKKILDNVSEISSDKNIEMSINTILIRKDGTIWSYSEEYGLTKITESTPSENEDEDKNLLNPTAQIHEKELGNKSILYGISEETKVEDFKKQNNFNNIYEVKVYDKNDKELQDNNIIGTGSKVKLYKQGKLVKEYLVILYGDTTGDGKITSVDALAVIKHINNKIPLKKEEYIEAGRVRKESKTNLTSVDALAIIKSVNGKYEITKNK